MKDLQQQSARIMGVEWQSMLNQKGIEMLEDLNKQLLHKKLSQLVGDM